MWVNDITKEKRTKRTQRKMRFLSAAAGTLTIILIFTFSRGSIGVATTGRFLKPSYEILPQFPVAVIGGIICGIIIYYLSGEKKKTLTLVCPKCEKIKEDDGIIPCECGGHFEDIKTMKWVEAKDDHGVE